MTFSHREQQFSTMLFTFLTTVMLVIIYTTILIKFYKRKRNYEKLRDDSARNNHEVLKFPEYSASKIYFIPVSVENLIQEMSNVSLIHMKLHLELQGKDLEIEAHRDHQANRSRRISRGFSFHMEYLKSSYYILTILLSFLLFHSPLFIYQAMELFR